MPVIGYLAASFPGDRVRMAEFNRGLSESGNVEGQNMTIEYRWAEGQCERLPALAADLVRRQVEVILASVPRWLCERPKRQHRRFQLSLSAGIDAVEAGIVASLGWPGGNVTGVTFIAVALAEKRLELLRELMPKPDVIAVLLNPNSTLLAQTQSSELLAAARAHAQRIHILNASSERELDLAFGALAKHGARPPIVGTDPFFKNRLALARRDAIPAIYDNREYAVVGGLMSNGASITDAYRQGGVYVGRRAPSQPACPFCSRRSLSW
jgi:putative tryptophan/tyrosine transport system substrate-binding protein